MSLVLNVEILGEFKKLTAATSGAGKDLKGLNTTAGKISKGINTALGAIGVGFSLAFLVNEFKDATKAAVEDRKSKELLSKALEDNLDATDAQVAGVERYISQAQIATGITDDKLRPAFGKLALSSGDLEESMRLMAIATDVAAGTGKDLDTVAQAMAKALEGNTASLGKLVPSVKDAKDPIQALADTFNGAAEAAAATDPYAKLQIIFGEIQEQIGTALLPILDKFSAWLSTPEGQAKMEEIAGNVVMMVEEFTKFVGYIFDKVVPALKQFIGDDTKGIVGLGASLSTAGGIIYFLLNSRLVMLAASNPIMAAAIAGVALIAAGMWTVYNNTKAANTQIDEFNRLNSIRNATSNPLATPEQINAATYQGILNAPTTKPTTTTTAPRGGIPTGNIVINNQTVVNTASTNATGVVSSLQAYQNQTGATLSKLLK
jgi:hypothetical protein